MDVLHAMALDGAPGRRRGRGLASRPVGVVPWPAPGRLLRAVSGSASLRPPETASGSTAESSRRPRGVRDVLLGLAPRRADPTQVAQRSHARRAQDRRNPLRGAVAGGIPRMGGRGSGTQRRQSDTGHAAGPLSPISRTLQPGIAPGLLVEPMAAAVIAAGCEGARLSPGELARFGARDWLHGRLLRSPVTGIAAGIDPDGALRATRRRATCGSEADRWNWPTLRSRVTSTPCSWHSTSETPRSPSASSPAGTSRRTGG